MANDINWQAVRAFNRAFAPKARVLSEGAAADRGFDCGEFSGAAHGRIWEEEYSAICDAVAKRFGVDAGVLFRQVEAAGYHQHHCWWVARDK